MLNFIKKIGGNASGEAAQSEQVVKQESGVKTPEKGNGQPVQRLEKSKEVKITSTQTVARSGPVMTNGILPPKAPEPVVAQTVEEKVVQKKEVSEADEKIEKKDSLPKEKSTSGQPAAPRPMSSKQEKIDFLTHLTQRSNKVMFTAQKKAVEIGDQSIDSQHLLFGLLKDPGIYTLLTEIGVQPQLVESELMAFLKPKGKSAAGSKLQPSPRVKKILSDSLLIARKIGYEFISPEHILLALYKEGEGVGARVLKKTGVPMDKLEKKVLDKKNLEEKEMEKKDRFDLSQYTIDLTARAQQGLLDPVVERADIIERVIHILSRRRKNNPVLIGEAGVGKTAIVEGLAQRIVKKEVPDTLLGKRILQLDLMSVVAGASHRGEFEERMKKIIETIIASQGEIILFIDEIHNIVGAGAAGDSGLDASNFLKPALARGEIQMIGATTVDEYRKYIEKDAALERRFQPVFVPEPTVEQAINMLKALKDKYEAYHKVRIPDQAIEAAVVLSKRYVGGRFLPDKAVDLIDEASAAIRLPLISLPEEIKSLEQKIARLKQEIEEAKRMKNKVREETLMKKLADAEDELKMKKEAYAQAKAQSNVELSVEMIKRIISSWTGIPLSKITESETEKLLKLEEIIHRRLIDQEIAVKAVAEAIRRSRAGLKSEKRPIGSFVFLGPTGVGKTELAKTLAEVLFGEESALIRFDMTEYMQKHEVAKLLGAPPGYVGYEEGGKLTEAVRRKPYSVILFDEIEKAHPDIFNILLQILDDGRLTDNKGRVISFKNTVVICTSNIGTRIIQNELLREGISEVEPQRVLDVYLKINDQEIVVKAQKVYTRAKGQDWQVFDLDKFFEDKKIKNSDLVSFPHKIDTLSFDKDKEFLSAGDLVYIRSLSDQAYEVLSLKDYFKGANLIAKSEGVDSEFPVQRWKTHNFVGDQEVISFRDRVWVRKIGDKVWKVMQLKDYFENHEVSSGEEFPVEYWDVHTNLDGKEAIIVGERVFLRSDDKLWKVMSLAEVLGEYPWGKESDEVSKLEEDVYKRIKKKVMAELGKFFRPELINRFDEIIVFEPLKYEDMKKIVRLQLSNLQKRLVEQDIGFRFTEKAVEAIVKIGFDPVFGARPLRRAIQVNIENVLSTEIIAGRIKPGDYIELDYDSARFIFNKIQSVPESEERAVVQQEKVVIKRFRCNKCGEEFQTEVVPNSTTICPKCLAYGADLQEVES